IEDAAVRRTEDDEGRHDPAEPPAESPDESEAAPPADEPHPAGPATGSSVQAPSVSSTEASAAIGDDFIDWVPGVGRTAPEIAHTAARRAAAPQEPGPAYPQVHMAERPPAPRPGPAPAPASPSISPNPGAAAGPAPLQTGPASQSEPPRERHAGAPHPVPAGPPPPTPPASARTRPAPGVPGRASRRRTRTADDRTRTADEPARARPRPGRQRCGHPARPGLHRWARELARACRVPRLPPSPAGRDPHGRPAAAGHRADLDRSQLRAGPHRDRRPTSPRLPGQRPRRSPADHGAQSPAGHLPLPSRAATGGVARGGPGHGHHQRHHPAAAGDGAGAAADPGRRGADRWGPDRPRGRDPAPAEGGGMSSRPPAPPPQLPGYEYEKLLGSGGFADVFLYRQFRPQRRVAIKVLLSTVHDDTVHRQ